MCLIKIFFLLIIFLQTIISQRTSDSSFIQKKILKMKKYLAKIVFEVNNSPDAREYHIVKPILRKVIKKLSLSDSMKEKYQSTISGDILSDRMKRIEEDLMNSLEDTILFYRNEALALENYIEEINHKFNLQLKRNESIENKPTYLIKKRNYEKHYLYSQSGLGNKRNAINVLKNQIKKKQERKLSKEEKETVDIQMEAIVLSEQFLSASEYLLNLFNITSTPKRYLYERHNSPTVSIILNIYPYDSHYKEALRAIQAQSVKAVEIIIFYNGHSDKILKYLKGEIKYDKRIILYTSTLKSIMLNRVKGINMANGKYILFMDPNVMFCNKHAISSIIALAEKKDADYLHFQSLKGNPKKSDMDLYKKSCPRLKDNSYVVQPDLKAYCPYRFPKLSLWDKLYLRQNLVNMLKKNNLSDTEISKMDPPLFSMLYAQEAKKYVALNIPLVWYDEVADLIPRKSPMELRTQKVEELYHSIIKSYELSGNSEEDKATFNYNINRLYVKKLFLRSISYLGEEWIGKYLKLCKRFDGDSFLFKKSKEKLKSFCKDLITISEKKREITDF